MIVFEKVAICIPTYNAGEKWSKCVNSILEQRMELCVLVIDSSSNDDTVEIADTAGFNVIKIRKEEFSHGGTRNQGLLALGNYEIVIFMTQDAILSSDDSIESIVKPFADPKVGIVTGRQLPHVNAKPIAAHARNFNYPGVSVEKKMSDISEFGIKTAFCSNSFSAYRVAIAKKCGSFPREIIFGEDMYLAAKVILSGYTVFYCAGAAVFHSHNYSKLEELRRNFDIGVFHSKESWMLDSFGGIKGEGRRFVLSELQYIYKKSPACIPEVIIRTFSKLIGYRLGRIYKWIPKSACRYLSLNSSYWR